MAFYKYPNFLHLETGREFDILHHPGQVTPFSGVYRCEVCHLSVTSVHSKPLPPQDHHAHNLLQGPIQWRLVVKTHR